MNVDAAASNSGQSLPTYGNPPLVETVLSVQFDPLPSMTDAHLGAFWYQHKDDWPRVQTQPPIEPRIETFREVDQWLPLGIELKFSPKPDIRVQMINEANRRMIQLQRDRLALNWRRHEGESYPRFPSLHEEFDRAWHELLRFVAEENLGDVQPRQWELIYVNHVDKGELWQGVEQWPAILSGLLETVSALADGTVLQGFQGQWVYEIQPKLGRFYVDASPARTADKPAREVINLRLTARGPIGKSLGLAEGLNLGHRVIVQSFDRLISTKAQRHWERHDDTHRP